MFHFENLIIIKYDIFSVRKLFLYKDNTHMIKIATYKTTGKVTTVSSANSGTTTIINSGDTSKFEAKIKELEDEIEKLKKRTTSNVYDILDLRSTEMIFNDMFKYGIDKTDNSTTIVAKYKIEQPK